ncbi:hypothetical protein HYT23_03530 [Candidatus Pacearchaeota archaeon]|nr:hypothetical protein [Candidatus Pacearchaeota archaeon]
MSETLNKTKVKKIKENENVNLNQLDLNAGDWIGICARNPGAHARFYLDFFILAKVIEPVLTPLNQGRNCDRVIALEYFLDGINCGGWNIHADSHLKLDKPFIYEESNVPQIEICNSGYYVAKSLYVGEDEITKALKKTPGFEIYADLIEYGRLLK